MPSPILPPSSFTSSPPPSLLPCVATACTPHTHCLGSVSSAEVGVGVLRAARARPEAAVPLSPLTAAKLQALTCSLHTMYILLHSYSHVVIPMLPYSHSPCPHSHILILVFLFPYFHSYVPTPCSHSHVLIPMFSSYMYMYLCYSAA